MASVLAIFAVAVRQRAARGQLAHVQHCVINSPDPQTDTVYGIINFVSAVRKTLQKMRKNQTGWRIEELQAVADENGVGWRRPGHGGSHVIFSASGVREIVSVPAKRPIKPVYIRQFPALVDNAVEVKQDEHKNKPKS
jgi:hypothetical protein